MSDKKVFWLKSQNLETVDSKLSEISPTFCLAKWKQTTTSLFNGSTHSCHHPSQHKIEVADIEKNHRALHNTPVKLKARQDMLNGVQTKECGYCWNIENSGAGLYSDRHFKSADVNMGIWPSYEEVVASGLGENIAPAYFEVAFENTCNFKCVYCSPDISSRWMDEVQTHGAYKLHTFDFNDPENLHKNGRFPIHRDEYNPYVEAFWKWWPELYESLNTFRITGGEPLLTENTWKVFDYIEKNPRPELNFSVNTNACVPDKLIDRLIDGINRIQDKVGNITIFTSAESMGAQAEYARYEMKWQQFERNCNRILGETSKDVRLSFMTTVNVLSLSTFPDFLRWVSALREKHSGPYMWRAGLGVSYLRHPSFLSMTNADPVTKEIFAENMTRVVDELMQKIDYAAINLGEKNHLAYLVEHVFSKSADMHDVANFVKYVDENDRRRKTNFELTFPELSRMYAAGKEFIG